MELTLTINKSSKNLLLFLVRFFSLGWGRFLTLLINLSFPTLGNLIKKFQNLSNLHPLPDSPPPKGFTLIGAKAFHMRLIKVLKYTQLGSVLWEFTTSLWMSGYSAISCLTLRVLMTWSALLTSLPFISMWQIYSWLSLNGHLYETDILVKLTPRVGHCFTLLPLFDSL